MRPWIFFDLDGTLLDDSERYAGVLRDYLGLTVQELRTQDFVQLRRANLKDDEIAKRLSKRESQFNVEDYKHFREAELEDDIRLKTDRLIVESSLLDQLSESFYLGLVTIRRNRENCLSELKRFDLLKFFSTLKIVRPEAICNAKVQALCAVENKRVLFGDSRIDQECAKALGIDFYYVKTGRESLQTQFMFLDVNEGIKYFLHKEKQNGIL